MKRFAVLCALLSWTACATAPAPAASPAAPSPADVASAPPAGAAAPGGAKKFSMRSYTFVLLRRGPAWSPEDTPETKHVFEGHLANIQAMARAGKLVLAGPFDAPATDQTGYAGIFVLDVASDDEARALLANDPAITSGRLVPELRKWYGPAGITYDGAGQFTP